MAMRDEIRAEREKLRGQSLRKRIGYFYEYYRLPFFAVLLLLLLGAGFLRELAGRKPTGFYALFLNAEPVGDAPLAAISENWYALLGIDEGTQEITVDAALRFDPEAGDETALAGTMRVTALLAAREADICISDPKLFAYYAESGAFLDLRELYSEEELAAYAGRLCYIDRQTLSSGEAAEDTDTENAAARPPREAETVERQGDAGAASGEAERQGNAGAATGEAERQEDTGVSPGETERQGDAFVPSEAAEKWELKYSPEGMAEPVPVGVVCEDGALQEKGIYRDTAVFAVFSNSRRQALAKRLLAVF